MKSSLLAGAAVIAVCAATGAWASEDGWYGAIDVGVHKMPGQATTPITVTNPSQESFRIKTKLDVAAFARIGYQMFPHLRVEIEGGYRPATLKSVTNRTGNFAALCNINGGNTFNPGAPGGIGGACGKPDGSFDTYTAMANVIFDLLPEGPLDA